ncbi:MAG: hypothetical protein JNK05_08415 [Myxococcales bacterium]|nr:hypothetical protein [Myxococcales bacterium]
MAVATTWMQVPAYRLRRVGEHCWLAFALCSWVWVSLCCLDLRAVMGRERTLSTWFARSTLYAALAAASIGGCLSVSARSRFAGFGLWEAFESVPAGALFGVMMIPYWFAAQVAVFAVFGVAIAKGKQRDPDGERQLSNLWSSGIGLALGQGLIVLQAKRVALSGVYQARDAWLLTELLVMLAPLLCSLSLVLSLWRSDRARRGGLDPAA